MRWKNRKILLAISLIFMASMFMFLEVSTETHLGNQLRLFVNPYYQELLDNGSTELKHTFYDLEAVLVESFETYVEDEKVFLVYLPYYEEGKLKKYIEFEVSKEVLTRELPVYFLISIAALFLAILMIASNISRKHQYHHLKTSLAYLSSGVIKTVPEIDSVTVKYNYALNELNKLLNKNAENEEKKMNFLSQISHELKTPIATIKAYLDGLKYIEDETKKEMYFDTITSTLDQLILRLDELFMLAQDEMNQFKYNFDEVYANQVFSSIFSRLHHEYLIINNQMTMSLIHVDVIRVEQVIQNLFNNAVKHCENKIEINAYREDDMIVVDVINDGNKISLKDMPYIFDVYYQGETSVKSDYKGAGIGLYICKEIMTKHKGFITVKSDTDTTFKLKFPIV